MGDRRRAERERRQSERVRATFAVKSVVGPLVQLAQAEDVAPGGLTLLRPRGVALRPTTPVVLQFELPSAPGWETGEAAAGDGHAAVTALGVVVSDNGSGGFRRTGIRFTQISPEHRDRLHRFCSRALASAEAGLA